MLPVKTYPNIEKILFLKKIKVNGKKIEKTEFKNGISSPFIIYFEMKDIFGEGYVVLRLYNKKKMIYTKKISFGEKGKIYESIIFWDSVNIKNSKRLRYVIFYKENLLYEGDIELRNR